jgi:DNA repair protein RadC
MKINTWPQQERPREKLLQRGAATLSDAELLAIFIHTGIKGKTALDIARDILAKHGNLRVFLEHDQKTICQHQGLGKAKYALLQAALELAKRNLELTLQKKDNIKHATAAYAFLAAKLRDRPNEVFACLFLNNANQVISYDELFVGTINNATVYPREIVKKALEYNAAKVILSHNHTSGSSRPSFEDKHLTNEIKKILAVVDIKVIDHIIIGKNDYYSFSEKTAAVRELKTICNIT